jgi:hypothetical protein
VNDSVVSYSKTSPRVPSLLPNNGTFTRVLRGV